MTTGINRWKQFYGTGVDLSTLQDVHHTDRPHPYHVGQACSGIGLLPGTRLTAELPGNLGYLTDPCRSDGMPHG